MFLILVALIMHTHYSYISSDGTFRLKWNNNYIINQFYII